MTIISLDTGATHVRYGELADLIATAMHPHVERLDNEASFGKDVEAIVRWNAARKALGIELSKAAQSGALPVKDPVTFGPRSYPDGDGLQNALVLVDDLRVFLNGRPISVVVADGMKALGKPQAVPLVNTGVSEQAAPIVANEIKKSALILKYESNWPTIERDLKDASQNRLSDTAKLPKKGFWNEELALQWARAQGKFTCGNKVTPKNFIFDLQGTKHTMQD